MKRFMAVFAVLAVVAVAGWAYADEPGYFGDPGTMARWTFGPPLKDATPNVKGSDRWSGGGPVESGAVPKATEVKSPADEGRIPPTSTFYNPFHPETRWIDLSGGN
jgi:hypothetical protein